MRLKATSSVLLLLLVSVQAFAAVCTVRCEAMGIVASRGPMPGMAHCHGMPSDHASYDDANATLLMLHNCSGQICQSDLVLLQSRTGHEVDSIAHLTVGVLTVRVPAAAHLEFANHLRFKSGRSTKTIPLFDPLISSLRI